MEKNADPFDPKTLLIQSEKMFENVQPLRSLQQELADNFYVESAIFTQNQYLGHDYASHLTTSYPLTVRRDLSNIFSTMLRPQDKVWAVMTTRNFNDLDEEGKRWLEWATGLLRNAMYDQDSGFEGAAAMADDDIATFGQAVISCEMNWKKRALLFRTWHLKDVAWSENYDGTIGRVDRKWRPYACHLNEIMKGQVHDKVKELVAKEPYKEINVRHMFVPIDDYAGKDKSWASRGFKYVSIFYDVDNNFPMETVPYKHEYYVIPRWKKIPGSCYAYSPAALAALPNARLAQEMMLTILEAGQKAVDPPMIEFSDFLRSDANLYAGGITQAEAEGFDPKLGSPLKPVFDSRTTKINIGVELLQMVQAEIRELFYLNKVGLPPMGSGMSTMEISQRVADYVRGALPLFAPLEPEYNARVCSLATDVLLANGGFGPPQSIPESLLGKSISFNFKNPLRETAERAKGAMLMESTSVLNQLAPFDPTVPLILDAHTTARDVLDGLGAPRKWYKPPEQVEEEQAAIQEKQQLATTMAAVDAGMNTAKTAAEANKIATETGTA